MYLILLQYIRPVAAIEHYMEQHRAFLDKYYKSGKFILAGRRKPKSGGLIICKAGSRKEVEEIMSEDPLDKFQLALYEIIEFEPTSYVNELQPYLS
ncbi:MAG: YCII-related [Bacteroidetes bacterium]|uniref:YciI family protein n=1 Tax=Chitinophaga TaxID=79328 RepID=UPI0009CBAE00|nr:MULTISPECIES: YciI family protein [Chitinophaga]MBP1652430.1 YCII-related [Bacteroidota bacterium]OMP77468.1 GTP cyclohydrolase [[Flexibacter] sp. ATCC 35208]WPQ64299.1 YciI family protein [Chitinophaga sancti]WPV68749.1 YciI family protein [Chitinophaga sp. LS1]